MSTYFFASASLINIAVIPDDLGTLMYTSVPDYNNVNFNFEEEEYIDDIPSIITDTCNETDYQKVISVDFEMDEEAYIDDIPEEIYNKL